MRQLYAYMSSKLIGRQTRRDSDAELYGYDMPPEPSEPGPFVRKFRQKFAKPLQELCGVDGETLVNLCKVKYFHSVFFLRHVSSCDEFDIICLCFFDRIRIVIVKITTLY